MSRPVSLGHRAERAAHPEHAKAPALPWGARLLGGLSRALHRLHQGLAEFYALHATMEPGAPAVPSRTLSLRSREVMNFAREPRARRITVLQGVVWLTGLKGEGDVLLRAGHSRALEGRGTILAEALGDATITLH